MPNNLKILVVGAGLIAREYIKVTQALGHQAMVVGRGKKKVEEVKIQYPQTETASGGLENWLKENKPPQYAIIATPIEHLTAATKALLKSGCKNILVEKPLTYTVDDANHLTELADQKGAKVSIAFNRRSYISVHKARELIAADGGVSSFHFDFTEAIFRINPANYSSTTNQYWGIANSSHVIDTAFFLGGKPKWMECRQYGDAVKWHPTGSVYTGMGETELGIPFTYHANWGCPGKWNIEIMTSKRKLLFSPMEQLHEQLQGSFKAGLVELDYFNDLNFKPGFYNQVKSWIRNESYLLSLSKITEEINVLNKIFGY